VPGSTPVVVSGPTDGVLELRLSDPARRNVLGRATIDALDGAIAALAAGTRVVLVRAEGPDFCAGYDLREAAAGDAAELVADESNFRALQRSPIPVIVAAQGNVIGGGLELFLAADVRLAAANARFSIPASRLGLVYSSQGVRLLIDELGESMTRSMLLAGKVLTVEEAHAIGLVAEVVAAESLADRARELAREVASWPAVATSGNRVTIDVVAGRVTADTGALRMASFSPEGSLAKGIARYRRARRPTWTRRVANAFEQIASLRRARAGRRS